MSLANRRLWFLVVAPILKRSLPLPARVDAHTSQSWNFENLSFLQIPRTHTTLTENVSGKCRPSYSQTNSTVRPHNCTSRQRRTGSQGGILQSPKVETIALSFFAAAADLLSLPVPVFPLKVLPLVQLVGSATGTLALAGDIAEGSRRDYGIRIMWPVNNTVLHTGKIVVYFETHSFVASVDTPIQVLPPALSICPSLSLTPSAAGFFPCAAIVSITTTSAKFLRHMLQHSYLQSVSLPCTSCRIAPTSTKRSLAAQGSL